MSSLPSQSGVTELQLKRVVPSITLMDEGQTNNANGAPSNHPTQFWCLLAMVAPAVHITQLHFLIGSFSKIEFSHWLRQCR